MRSGRIPTPPSASRGAGRLPRAAPGVAGGFEPAPDYGAGKAIPGLLPLAAAQLRAASAPAASVLRAGDRVFMQHLRGGVLVRIVSVEPQGVILGRVVATKGVLRDAFIDEIVQVPPECVARVLPGS
jgi:hypothetical protein